MPDLGKYAVEVLAAYGVSITLLFTILGLSWRRYTRVRDDLAKVEKNG